MRNRIVRAFCVLAALFFAAGCGAEAPAEEANEPKPWAAPSTDAVTAVEETETTQRELSTLAALETDELGITLPDGVTQADILAAEQMLWNTCFFTELPESATAEQVVPFLTDGASPHGLLCIYDAADPAHTHGAIEAIFVETEADPLERFPDMYYKVEDTVIEFLLRDVFGVQEGELPQAEDHYRLEDVWYFQSLAVGNGGYETHIRACQILEDGRYRLTAELQQKQEDESLAHARSAFAVVEPVQQDDLRFLRICSIEPFE